MYGAGQSEHISKPCDSSIDVVPLKALQSPFLQLETMVEGSQDHIQKVSYLLLKWRGSCVHTRSRTGESFMKQDFGPLHTIGLLPDFGLATLLVRLFEDGIQRTN